MSWPYLMFPEPLHPVWPLLGGCALLSLLAALPLAGRLPRWSRDGILAMMVGASVVLAAHRAGLY
jgi:hypothetical protein